MSPSTMFHKSCMPCYCAIICGEQTLPSPGTLTQVMTVVFTRPKATATRKACRGCSDAVDYSPQVGVARGCCNTGNVWGPCRHLQEFYSMLIPARQDPRCGTNAKAHRTWHISMQTPRPMRNMLIENISVTTWPILPNQALYAPGYEEVPNNGCRYGIHW